MITKIHIQNYRVFQNACLEFRDGLNIMVGDNDAGKSTILEAVNLALTGRLRGKTFAYELSPHLFNRRATEEYLAGLMMGTNPAPPELIIDLYLRSTTETDVLLGSNNILMEDAPGIRIRAAFNDDYAREYAAFISDPNNVRLVPTEYYRVEWLNFGGGHLTARGVPATASFIDASAIRLYSGADHYLQQIIAEHLTPAERVELSRAYRSLREGFADDTSVGQINQRLARSEAGLTDKELSLAIDVSYRTAWESNLVPHLDDLPLHFVGNGGQHALKMLLALSRSADAAHVVLIEEPENHLSPGSLNALVRKIQERCAGKQVLITTHNSYVLNKLGLDHLLLLNGARGVRLSDLPPTTLDYFRKLSGYDTLRLVLAKRAILVEGPSDELIVQRAFKDAHGVLPLEAGVDVINVRGLSFARFLDIAKPLGKTVTVITDNDGRSLEEISARYGAYADVASISLCPSHRDEGDTLEPQIIAVNSLDLLNQVLGTTHATRSALEAHMRANKTSWALKILEAAETITMPRYIRDAIA